MIFAVNLQTKRRPILTEGLLSAEDRFWLYIIALWLLGDACLGLSFSALKKLG